MNLRIQYRYYIATMAYSITSASLSLSSVRLVIYIQAVQAWRQPSDGVLVGLASLCSRIAPVTESAGASHM